MFLRAEGKLDFVLDTIFEKYSYCYTSELDEWKNIVFLENSNFSTSVVSTLWFFIKMRPYLSDEVSR